VLILVVGGVLALSSAVAPAAEEAGAAAEAASIGSRVFTDLGLVKVSACFGAGLVLLAGATGIARIGTSAVESMARQPEASGAINGATVITAAMVEGATLFGVVVCLLAVL